VEAAIAAYRQWFIASPRAVQEFDRAFVAEYGPLSACSDDDLARYCTGLREAALARRVYTPTPPVPNPPYNPPSHHSGPGAWNLITGERLS
jgi:hypothetical protein